VNTSRGRKLTLPNVLTASRLVLLPVLWAIASSGAQRPLAIGIAIAVSTDALDGLIARAFDMRSDFGSRLDSIADHMLSASVLAWLVWLRPEFVARFAPWLIGWLVFSAMTLAVGWIRFHRIGDLHLLSTKLAMAVAYLFVVTLFYYESYRPLHVWIVLVVCFVGVGESLLVYLTRTDPNERIGSILSRRMELKNRTG
jgi:cardiolipin synthase